MMNIKIRSLIMCVVAGLLYSSCAEDKLLEKPFIDTEKENGESHSENPHWEWVTTFPGWLNHSEERVESAIVSIDVDYKKITKESRMNYKMSPWISTGYYAAPGEWVKLIVPAQLQGKIGWRIGAWNCIPNKVDKLRFPKIYETGEIISDTTKILNYFGGQIYIVPKEFPFVQVADIEIQGAVVSPDFVQGKSDVKTWKERLKASSVPFAELRGKRTIWTMSRENLLKIEQPEELLKLYDEIIEKDFDELYGLSENPINPIDQAPTFPLRFVQDIQMCGTEKSHTGYPIIFDLSDIKMGINYDDMRNTSVAWNFYREVGHIYQSWCWKWADGAKAVNMIPYYHSKARILRRWPSKDTDADEDKSIHEWEYIINDYVMKSDENKDFESSSGIGEAINRYNGRMMPFIQLVQKYGWGIITHLSRYSRHHLEDGETKVLKALSSNARRDYFCKRVSEYAGANMIPFFDAWGIKYSENAKQDMEKLDKYPTPPPFWNTWDKANLGDVEFERTATDTLPDNNYSIESWFNQKSWTIDSTIDAVWEVYAGITYHPKNMVDGDILNMASTHPTGNLGAKRPLYTTQYWFAFDMEKSYRVTQGGIHHRGTKLYTQTNVETYKVELKKNPEDTWTEFKIATQIGWDNTGWHNFKVEPLAEMEARYVRLTVLRGYGNKSSDIWEWPHAWPNNEGGPEQEENGQVCIGEFRLGGTLLFDGGDEGDSENDPDFPDWDQIIE